VIWVLLHKSRLILSFCLSVVLACSFSPGHFKHGRLFGQLQYLLLIVHVEATFIPSGIWKGMVLTRYPFAWNTHNLYNFTGSKYSGFCYLPLAE
jgi:hypothetical protein